MPSWHYFRPGMSQRQQRRTSVLSSASCACTGLLLGGAEGGRKPPSGLFRAPAPPAQPCFWGEASEGAAAPFRQFSGAGFARAILFWGEESEGG